jgi:hypothetical protein
MNIKEFIEILEDFAEDAPKGMDTEVWVANMYGKENLTYGNGFYELTDDELVIISSYYHYKVKYNQQGEHKETEPILRIDDVYSFINGEDINDYAIWEITNGVGRIIESNTP